MADTKTSALASLGTPVGADYVFGVLASGPTDKKLLASDLRDYTNMVQATGTDADTTMAINALYVVDMSAWATADRTYTLPATAAVGDRIGVMVTAGDATHELVLTAGTGDTLNGIAGGTEWSRLFITNEVVIMRCIVANATWIVEYDGRIPCKGGMSLAADEGSKAAATFNKVGLDVSDFTVGGIVDASAERINIRRTGIYSVGGIAVVSLNVNGVHIGSVYVNGTETRRAARASTIAATSSGVASGCIPLPLTAGDYVELYIWHDAGTQTHQGGNVADGCRLSVIEEL